MSSSRRRQEKKGDDEGTEDERQLYSSGKDTAVEVTVKIKKRRGHNLNPNNNNILGNKYSNTHHHNQYKAEGLAEKVEKEVTEVFRKGSWGDLLSQHREQEVKKTKPREKSSHNRDYKGKEKGKKVQDTQELKCPEGKKTSSGTCQALPVLEGWRMETHSHPTAAFVEKGYQRVDLKCPEGRVGPRGGTCHMIPISEELCLETHTHLKTDQFGNPLIEKNAGKKDGKKEKLSPIETQEMENDQLKREIGLMKQDLEVVKRLQGESIQLMKKLKNSANPAKPATMPTMPMPSGLIPGGEPEPPKLRRAEKPTLTTAEAVAILANLPEDQKKTFRPKPRITRSRSESPVILRESKGTSTSFMEGGRRSEITQTDGRTPERLRKQDELKTIRLEELEVENLALRREAQRTYHELMKAQKDHADSIETMRELYKTAECLKNENQLLLAKQEQQQLIHERLIAAINENQQLKKFLESAVSTLENSAEKENELEKIRNVIDDSDSVPCEKSDLGTLDVNGSKFPREVKNTIETEMQEINHNHSSVSLYEKPEMIRGFECNFSERESTALNDTNSSEIQRILGSLDQEVSNEERVVGKKSYSSVSVDLDNCSLDQCVRGFLSSSHGAKANEEGDANPNDGGDDANPNEEEDDANPNELVESVSKAFRPIQDELLNLSSSTGSSD